MKNRHTTVRLSDEGWARLEELAPIHSGQTGAMEAALLLLHRETFPDRYPHEEPAIIGWVWGKTTGGREGWKPQLEGGGILDEIDEDVDDAPATT